MNVYILSALLFLAPITPESAKFTISQDGKKIGSEQFTITARPGGGYVAEAQTVLSVDSIPITSRMELDERLNPTSYEYKRGTSSIQIKFDDPVSEYNTVADGKESSLDFRFPAGGVVIDNNFFLHYLLLLYKVGAAGGTIPVFVPQDMRLGSAVVRPLGSNKYRLEIGDIDMEATTDASGRLIRLLVPEAGVVVER